MIEGALWRAVPSLATLHSREPHRSRLIGLRQLFPPPPCHPRRRTLPLLESGRPDRQGTIYTPSRPLMIVTRLPENRVATWVEAIKRVGTRNTGSNGRIPHMTVSPLAGKPAPKEMLIDPARLEREYFGRQPDLDDPNQLVKFGTSGHPGSAYGARSPGWKQHRDRHSARRRCDADARNLAGDPRLQQKPRRAPRRRH